MSQISTLSELLALSDSQYRIFDIGRTISKISKEQFDKLEHGQIPYPQPFQAYAHLAIAFWQKLSPQPYLWFVKLPLDERGLLNLGARNHFIAIIIEALGNDLTADPSEKQEELLNANPYHFKPAEYKLAALNSQLKVELKQAASSHYEHAQLYFSGQLGWNEWQGLGVQGICDFATRLGESAEAPVIAGKANETSLINAIAHLPKEVLTHLASALESQTLSYKLITELVGQLAKTKDAQIQSLYLRALASNCEHPLVIEAYRKLILENHHSLEFLATVSGRCWPLLASEDDMLLFFEKVVASHDSQTFAALFQDLVAIPQTRMAAMLALRSEARTEQLSQAIGELFSAVKTQS